MWGTHQERKTYIALVLGMLCAWSPAWGLSDKRLCADPNCQTIISTGTAKIKYSAGQQGMVSFNNNANIRVKSKSAGSDPSLWGIEVNGREGYAPKEYILEKTVRVPNDKLIYEVPVKGVAAVSEQPAVLKASETVRAASIDELTTTRPLEAVNASILTAGEKEEVSGQHQPTVVEAAVEIIDGTKVPMLEDVVIKPASGEPDIGEAKPMEPKPAELNVYPPKLAVKPVELEELSEPITVTAAQLQEPPKAPVESAEGNKVELETSKAEKVEVPKVPPKLDAKPVDLQKTKEPITVKAAQLEEPKVPLESAEGDAVGLEASKEQLKSEKLEEPKVPLKLGEMKLETPKVSAQPAEKLETFGDEEEDDDDEDDYFDDEEEEELYEEEAVVPSKEPELKKTAELTKPTAAVQPIAGESKKDEKLSTTANLVQNPAELEESATAKSLQTEKIVESINAALPENSTQPEATLSEAPSDKAAKVEVGENTTMRPEVTEFERHDEVFTPDLGILETVTMPSLVEKPTKRSKTRRDLKTEIAEEMLDPKVETDIEGELFDHVKHTSKQDSEAVALEKLPEIQISNTTATVSQTAQQTKAADPIELLDTKELLGKAEIESLNGTHEITEVGATEAPLQVEVTNRVQESQREMQAPQERLAEPRATDAAHEHITSTPASEEPLKATQPEVKPHIPGFGPFVPQHQHPEDQVHKSATPPHQHETHQQPSEAHQRPNLAHQHSSDIHQPPNVAPQLPNVDNQLSNEAKQDPNEARQQPNEVTQQPTESLHHSNHVHQHLNEANQDQNAAHQHHYDPYHYTKPTERTPELRANDQVTTDTSQPAPPPTPSTDLPLPNQDERQTEAEQQPTLPEVQTEEVGVAGVGTVEEERRSDPIALPSQAPQEAEPTGLFATIVGTVNSFLSNDKKEAHVGLEDDELQRILFPESAKKSETDAAANVDYCEKLTPNSCPNIPSRHQRSSSSAAECHCGLLDINADNFVEILTAQALEMGNLLACLGMAGLSTVVFLFGYYCFFNSSREGALLSKLNMLERSLLASHKESSILKHDLLQTRSKLSSIEDNSFGSNEMVIALKQELENVLLEKGKLQENLSNLERELENATEAGLELNKIVSELLSNQTGDESIISSVEELQRQLNEQQNTIMEINAILAEKSRENSELQLMLSEQSARLGGEIASLQQDNDELEAEKSSLQTRLEEVRNECDEDISKALEGKNYEIKRLQNEIIDIKVKLEDEHNKWQTSLAKVEALEDCLKTVKRDPGVNINQMIDVANVRAEVIDLQKKRAALKERLDAEMDARRIADNQLQIASNEVERLKQDFNQSEKDKLEAQTRLEVLSNYFKDKENQLQKELSLKEAMWLKQQGETISTVDRVTAMQDEIQSLKSQNDALRAEIEAQLAAHKAQTGTLENRAHETWLAARQSERRYEEVRAEATALRRKLTALMGGNPNEIQRPPNAAVDGKLGVNELNNVPSPIHMESPGSPLLGRLPPPPPFLPPPFMAPFMGMPPPPFVPPGEMRPPPLGRLMSPPPPGASSGGPPHAHLRSGRYSPDYALHGDYDDDDDDDDKQFQGRRRWNRDSFSPPRSYRSHSPTDSRYNYTDYTDGDIMYDSETDLSPPPSPRDRRRGSRTDSYKAYSPPPAASSPLSPPGKRRTTPPTNKGVLSSGSERSNQSAKPRSQHKSMV